MCVSTGPAKLSNTIGLVKTLENGNVITAYQMSTEVEGDGDRVMIIQLPVRDRVITLHDTRLYASFLTDMQTQIENMSYDPIRGVESLPVSRGMTVAVKKEKIGMYEVVYLFDLNELKNLSAHLNCDVNISDELFEFYKTYYSGFCFIAVKFSNRDKMRAQPLLFEYKPFYVPVGPENIPAVYFPAVDNDPGTGIHSGVPEDIVVNRDHTIFYPAANGLHFNSNNEMLSGQYGWYSPKATKNGDFIFSVKTAQRRVLKFTALKGNSPETWENN